MWPSKMSQIAQYIEDYLDLIENSPNEIIRKITQLHEKNHLYSKLSEKLEEMLKILLDNGGTIGEIQAATSDDRLQADKQAKSDSVKDSAKDSVRADSALDSAKDSAKSDSDKSKECKSNETTSDKKAEERNRPEEEKRPEELDENKQPDKQLDKQLDKQAEKTKQLSAEEEAERIALRKQRALGSVSRLLLEIQEIEDEKLAIVQSVLEHLDFKNKQLELDFRNLSSSQSTNSKSNSNSSSQNTNDEDSLSGNQENSNNELNHQKETAVCSASAQLSQSSSVNNHHHSSSNSKRASSRRNLATGSKEFTSNDLNSSHNGNNNNGNSSSNHKRGVKRGSGVSGKSSNREIKRNRSNSQRDLENSPTNPFDEAPIDPDEPTYCICEQVSFGEMICCDNLDCPIEWFHFGCVGLTSKPRGKWYCPNCRGDRSNIPKK